MSPTAHADMSTLEFHVLLALASGPLYGYAIKDAITTESGRALEPRAGSLYRVIARLMASGLVRETDPATEPPPHPGLTRKYYALTRAGRATLGSEASRLKQRAALAEGRLGLARGNQ